jgi:hypothetical protein
MRRTRSGTSGIAAPLKIILQIMPRKGLTRHDACHKLIFMERAEYENLKRRIDADHGRQIATADAERQRRLEALEVLWQFAGTDSVTVADPVALKDNLPTQNLVMPTQNPVLPTQSSNNGRQIESPLFPVQNVQPPQPPSINHDNGRERIKHGLLMRAVRKALGGIGEGERFELDDVEYWLGDVAPEIASRASRQTITTCLRRLAETDDLIELVAGGTGKRSNVYRKKIMDEEEDSMND